MVLVVLVVPEVPADHAGLEVLKDHRDDAVYDGLLPFHYDALTFYQTFQISFS